jgi:hypothetical protein
MDLIDYFQQRQLTNLQSDVSDASANARRGERETAELRETVDRLVLACEAMWALLGERAGLSQEDLLAKVREIDLLDGTLDGRLRRQSKNCPSCRRANSARRLRCLYCAALLAETAF